jgi:predicted ATP-dependent serine protease
MALVVAVYSAIKRQSVQAGLVILGDLSNSGKHQVGALAC